MSNELQLFQPGIYTLPPTGAMRVPGLVVGNDRLFANLDIERPLEQVRNVACLPGIVDYSIAMPDIHWGYGFPIGGVAAMDVDTGVISPGGVGYDINCGVRLALAKIPYATIDARNRGKLLQTLFKTIPSGVGRGNKGAHALTDTDYAGICQYGSQWAIAKGLGLERDTEHAESHGCLPGADLSTISSMAKERGATQLGTIGSGNHFVEIGAVEQLNDPHIAQKWGMQQGDTYILIHSGSRGFGHQTCQDTLNLFMQQGFSEGLPDPQLVCAPLQSIYGKNYMAAMAMAANFAFTNRQMILDRVRKGFAEVLELQPEQIPLIYDVCHNIAKFEKHQGKTVCVHRKGATRSFGPGAKELPPLYQETGQPVIVPGDMGRASHVLAGLGNPLTFHSCCHGAGRAKSRIQCAKGWKGKEPKQVMKAEGVQVMATSYRTIAEEMPDAYKDVEMVVDAVQEAQLAKKVARLKPSLVIKG